MDSSRNKPANNNGDICSFPRHYERCRNCRIRGKTMAKHLSPGDLDKLDAIMVSREFLPGTTIVGQGETSSDYYNIFDGVVRLVKLMPDGRRSIVSFLFPGDFFGFSINGDYPYSAEAVNRVRTCTFPKPEMRRLFKEIPALEEGLLTLMSEKLISSHGKIADLARKSPRERLATFLLDLSTLSTVNPQTDTIEVPMGREDISDYLGLTIETISRTFSSFAREGLIRMERRNLLSVAARDQLKKIAEGESRP